MRAREQILVDIASGDLTERVGIGTVERHRAAAYASRDHPLSAAIDRLRAEARAKDAKHPDDQDDFRPRTARVVASLLLDVTLERYPAEFKDISAWDQRKLALIALMERTIRRCSTCNGRRELKVSDVETILCIACMGTGRVYAPSSDRRNKAFGRKLGHDERRALKCLLVTWDQNEHATAEAVGDMHAETL